MGRPRVGLRSFVVLLGLAAASALLAARVTTDALGGRGRFLTHLSTDKPIYRPGEKVFVRGVLLDAISHKPIPADQRAQAMIEIRGPKGETVARGWAVAEDSVLGFQWPIPQGQVGGEYKVKVSYPSLGQPPAERKFDIRLYRPPRLKSQIVFLRDGYGPGDKVTATLHVERAEGGVPVGATVEAIPRLDGQVIWRGQTTVDPAGNCSVSFKLPEKIERGDGTLALVIRDGGVVETAAKTIPILLQTVDLKLYPEGGGLVAGLPNRIYFEARTPARKPADIAGEVLDADGNLVAAFRSEHEGRGRFAFTPRRDGRYSLKITEPSGIKTTFPLPTVKERGAIIRSLQEAVPPASPVRLRVGSTDGGRLTVSLARREVEVASVSWNARPGVLADVVLMPPATADGVLVATVWDANARPLAERLVFRHPARSVRVAVKPLRPSYVPGEKVRLTVKTTDEAGEPVSAVVGLTVTDDSVLEMIEKREQAPRLPVMVLLENEVEELADAHVYLDPQNPKAPLALDLLLGTQGWRRFAFVDAQAFLKKYGEKAIRALAFRRPPPPPRPTAERGGRFRFALGALPKAAAKPQAALRRELVEERVEDEAAELEGHAADKKAEALRARFDLAEAAEKAKKREFADRPIAREELAQADEEAMARRLRRSQMVPVRVYAHKVRPGRKPNDRVDFTETLYWCAGIKTDPNTGEATVEFGLSDAVTSFRVLADAFGADGSLGAGTATVESVEPFYIEPKLPLEVTAGDLVQLPLSLVNGLDSEIVQVAVNIATDPEVKPGRIEPFNIGAKGRIRRILPLSIGHLNGAVDFVLEATSGGFSDKVTRKLRVVPLGFPVEVARGGMTTPNGAARHTVEIPEGVVPRSMTASATVYPTPLANLTEALARLIRDPYGCFEQTSSTTYPLVMAQQYFLTHTGVPAEMVRRSREKLDKGYRRLVGFECKKRGYEWFGGDPGHEALTAYGILEFTDMARTRPVDASMLERTRRWLLSRRDGKGGFKRNPRALDSFGRAPEIQAATDFALKSNDTYVVALGANIAALSGDQATARKLMDKLVKKQAPDGHLEGAVTSITRSGGLSLKVETTALGVLAWLREPAYAGAVEQAIKFIADSCQGGRFGSTQATVLALRAIVAYDKARAKPKAPGSVRIVVDGQAVGDPVKFDEKTQGAIKLPDISELLTAGKHTVELAMAEGSQMPYSISVAYHTTTPLASPECKVELKTGLSDTKLDEGAATEVNALLRNLSKEPLPMTVAIVGLPGGLEPRHDQLKELVKAGRIAAYEVRGREVVLYWRQLLPEQRIEVPISCVAVVPGTYTGPASRAYLYYTDEFKSWVPGLKIEIAPRAR